MLCALLVTACGTGGGGFRIGGIESLAYHGFSGLEVALRVDNSTPHRLQLRRGEVLLCRDGEAVVRASVSRPVAVESRTDGVVLLPLRLRMADPLTLASVARRFAAGEEEGWTVSVEAVVRAGWGRRKIRIEKMAMSDFLNTFDLSPGEFAKQLER